MATRRATELDGFGRTLWVLAHRAIWLRLFPICASRVLSRFHLDVRHGPGARPDEQPPRQAKARAVHPVASCTALLGRRPGDPEPRRARRSSAWLISLGPTAGQPWRAGRSWLYEGRTAPRRVKIARSTRRASPRPSGWRPSPHAVMFDRMAVMRLTTTSERTNAMRVYVDGDDRYCVDCHESTEELIPVEAITEEDVDGDTTGIRCAYCGHQASLDEMESFRLPIPGPEYAHHALLQSDYLPGRSQERDELPPCFSSKLLTPEIADDLIAHTEPGPAKNQDRSCDSIAFRLNRHANSTRLLKIPHPEAYVRLCRVIVNQWDEITTLIEENKESQIVPKISKDNELVSMGPYEADETESHMSILRYSAQRRRATTKRLDRAIGKRYLARADIAVFFPSVYTHAIPWAIHTKEIAKRRRRDKRLYGNLLDERSRNMQRGETLGIPIGPATSNILSELLLNPVDTALRDDYTFLRFIDDYRCYCVSKDEADAFIVALENQLAEYGLQLNASKTSITPLPATTTDPWVIQLRTLLDAINLSQPSTLGSLFDLAINLQAKWPNKNVVKYAARALARHATTDDLRHRCTRHILEIAFHYPSVMPILARLVQKDPAAVRAEELERLLLQQAKERAPTDAMCWTLFAWREQTSGTKTLPSDLAEAVIETGDCMAIASLWAIDQAEDDVVVFVKTKLSGSTDEEYDRYWLLVHEVGDNVPETQLYREKTGLQLLADEDVSFIDRSAFTGNDDEPM